MRLTTQSTNVVRLLLIKSLGCYETRLFFFAFFLFFALTWSWKSISSSYSSTSSPGPFLQKRNCVFTYLKTCLPIHSPPSLYVLGKYDWLLPPLSASPAFPSNNPIFFFFLQISPALYCTSMKV